MSTKTKTEITAKQRSGYLIGIELSYQKKHLYNEQFNCNVFA
jgi:hypothetical protein